MQQKWNAMTSQMGDKGKERHCKVPPRPLDLLRIFSCLDIMSVPSSRFLPRDLPRDYFAVFQSYNKSIILDKTKVNSNHYLWPRLNFRKGQFMVPQFGSHGRQLAVFARTGAAPVHAGAEARTQVLYLCEFTRRLPMKMKRFPFLLIGAKYQKICA